MICKAPDPADRRPRRVSEADVVIVRKIRPLHERWERYTQLFIILGGLTGLAGVLLLYLLCGLGYARLAAIYVACGLSLCNAILIWVPVLLKRHEERPHKVLTPKRKG